MEKTVTFERRTHPAATVEFRAQGPKEGRLTGYAAVFDSPEHGELIQRGAFTKTLQESKRIDLLWAHDKTKPLASTRNGTLRLSQDSHGLKFEATLSAKTTWGADAYEACRAGLVQGMSFGFRPIKSGTRTLDGQTVRVLREMQLEEISVCPDPWYTETSVEARSKNSLANRLRRLRLRLKSLSLP